MKTMTCKGFQITERNDGTFRIVYNSYFGKYIGVCPNFNEAGEWVFEMADNHDIGRAVNHKMCDVFGRTFGDVWDCIGF